LKMADYSALPLQIISYDRGDLPLDITPNLESIDSFSGSALDTSGFAQTTVTITLASNTPGFLETRFNSRWAIANKIELFVRNAAGTEWILHKTLRILDSYFDDGVGEGAKILGINTLELELGDLFALKNRRFPPPGDIDIPILENQIDVPVVTTCNYWLRIFDLPEITILPGDEVPPGRNTTTGLYTAGSGVIEHIGRILYANHRFMLWVDSLERVRVRRVGLPVATDPFVWASIDQRWQYYKDFSVPVVQNLAANGITFDLLPMDMIINKRSASEREKVAGTVQILGTSLYRFPYVDPPSTTISTNENGVTTTETISVNTSAGSRTTTKVGTQQVAGLEDEAGNIGQYREITIESYGGGIPQTPNPNPVLPPYPGLPAYLQSTVTTIEEQRFNSAEEELDPLAITKRVSTHYRYLRTTELIRGVTVHGAQVQQVSEVTEILPEGENNLIIDQIKTSTWKRQGEDIYLFTESIVRPATPENRRYSQNTSSTGQSTPPATTNAPIRTISILKEIYGEARFNYPPDSPDNDTPRSYNFDAYFDNNRNAGIMAEHLGSLLIGRNEALTMGFRPTDAWLADPHPVPWAVVRGPGDEDDLYLLDIPVLALGDRQCYLGGSGIWFGRRDRLTGAITPPYEIQPGIIGAGNTAIGYGNILIKAGF
jgi:hypothetical protein